MNPQVSMFVAGTPRHHHLEFTLRDGTDPQRVAVIARELAEVADRVAVNAVFGFSGELWATLAPSIAPAPVPFPVLDGVPDTPADVWAWLHGDDAGDMFDAVRAVATHLAPVAMVTHEVDGWIYHDQRDLTGFIDGTENPPVDERPSVALVPDGEPGAGGSFVITQRWEHDLDAFAALDEAEQEGVIGRTKTDSVELDDAVRPDTAHISRVVIEEDGEELEIVRRSVPYGGAVTAGLHFVGFSGRPDTFTKMLDRMFGTDGVHDRLTEFSKPVTGNYWFVPDLDELADIGRPDE